MTTTHDDIRQQQRRTWNKFSAGWKKWDNLVLSWCRPVGVEMIRSVRLRDDSRVLDIATGTGEPGLLAAAQVPRGRVVGTDLSEDMLAVARENALERGIHNFDTRIADATQLPFAAGEFDALLCRYGLMFFPDIKLGLQEFARVLKDGGTVSVAVWGSPAKNDWATTTMGTINAIVQLPPPPPDLPGLFRCAAPGAVAELFQFAGFSDLTETEVSGKLEFTSTDQYWEFINEVAAPVVAAMANLDEGTKREIKLAVYEKARQFTNGKGPAFPWSATVVSGQKGS